MSLEVSLEKRFGRGGFSLAVDFASDGCFGLLGASGGGKSMTLKCLAGIDRPDRGRVVLNGRVLFDSRSGIDLRPQRRRVGYLFQSYALFPSMTVGQNIQAGMAERGAERRLALTRLLGQFRLEDLAHRFPHQLSGGQQQRVALARLLAARPEMVLLDEPFSALDAYLREQTRIMVRDLLASCRDVVLVTHNRDDAYQLCSHLAVIDDGRIVGMGPTRRLFARPGRVTVARLTGCKNISPIRRLAERQLHAVDWGIDLETAEPIGAAVTHIGVRAHDFRPVPSGAEQTMANVIPVLAARQYDEPFEEVVIFRPRPEGYGGHAGELWWKYGKDRQGQRPDWLSLPRDRIMLLES
ncbi:MAG: ATP-binding cassette domain-containing protein [Planctomycetes bacterium]|nr:ATP-binding cassette domain-containing protein [Planctomycetota bacterium]